MARHKGYKEGVGVLLGILVMGWCLAFGGMQTKAYTQSEQMKMMEQAIMKAVVQCYALEGVYPPSIAYISEHYGLEVDEQKYAVYYEIFASNVMPQVKVLPLKGAEIHE
ncbi:MAG: hypothetical protein ACRCW2_12535 [Cellulosilyticaceae bacterium]